MFNKLAKWVTDLYYTQQRRPDEPEITVQKGEEDKHILVFPDGTELKLVKDENKWVVENCSEQFFRNIPDFSAWKEPMKELWLLFLKDRKSWKITKENVSGKSNIVHTKTYLHINLDINICRTHTQIGFGSYTEYKGEGIALTKWEIAEVMRSFEVYKYTDKMLRLGRIQKLRTERIEREKRSDDAKRIREYLNANK